MRCGFNHLSKKKVETENKLPQLTPAPVIRGTDTQTFPSQTNAVLMVPDRHGDLEIYNRLYTDLENDETYDSFVPEMLNGKLQGNLTSSCQPRKAVRLFSRQKKPCWITTTRPGTNIFK